MWDLFHPFIDTALGSKPTKKKKKNVHLIWQAGLFFLNTEKLYCPFLLNLSLYCIPSAYFGQSRAIRTT